MIKNKYNIPLDASGFNYNNKPLNTSWMPEVTITGNKKNIQKPLNGGTLPEITAVGKRTYVAKNPLPEVTVIGHKKASNNIQPVPQQTYTRYSNASEANNYKIQRGDTVSGLAKKLYGNWNPDTIEAIMNKNKLDDANKISTGYKLYMPSKDEIDEYIRNKKRNNKQTIPQIKTFNGLTTPVGNTDQQPNSSINSIQPIMFQ